MVRLSLDTSTRVLQDNDVFILCSDGLTDVLSDSDIVGIIEANPSDMVADALVESAIENGTQDNVIVVAVFCGGQLPSALKRQRGRLQHLRLLHSV